MPPNEEYTYTAGLVEEMLLGGDTTDLSIVEYQVDCLRAWEWYRETCPKIAPLVQANINGYTHLEIASAAGLHPKLVLAALTGAYREMAVWLNT